MQTLVKYPRYATGRLFACISLALKRADVLLRWGPLGSSLPKYLVTPSTQNINVLIPKTNSSLKRSYIRNQNRMSHVRNTTFEATFFSFPTHPRSVKLDSYFLTYAHLYDMLPLSPSNFRSLPLLNHGRPPQSEYIFINRGWSPILPHPSPSPPGGHP